ncbi:MAG: 4Fe-4S dicluster domain-containing protein [Chloroflexi bacterium]|nr:4Fe-4S dicluster domain-containing protein [Chloroflexota bacterium]
MAGIALSLIVNFIILGAALRPLRDLRQLAERLKSGGGDAVLRLKNPDPDTIQLAATLHSLVTQLEARNRELRALSERAINAQEDELEWRAARKSSEQGLTGEALQFAPQGGISAYRYRAACQMCVSPGATEADVNIGILGLPVRQTVLVDVKNGPLDWKTLTDGTADHALSAKRDIMLAKLSERHTRTRERVINGLIEVLPTDVEALLDQFENCGACQMCMDSCPICTVEYPRQVKGRYRREDVAAWLASCAGCGMCEQSCPQHLPLSIIFTHVKQQLQQALAI